MFLLNCVIVFSICVSKILCVDLNRFEVDFQWDVVNYTWATPADYQDALNSKRYIPINNAMCGIKYYKDKIYLAMPRIREGQAVTLGYINVADAKSNPLVTPYPNWDWNNQSSCDNLQSVQSMEISADGIMWVIDGMRIGASAQTNCSTKLFLFDLNRNGELLHKYVFPEEISRSNGGFLNDIVLDREFAYITEASGSDYGLIVYSLARNHAWKVQDASSMLAEPDGSDFIIDGANYHTSTPIDGIALSSILQENPQRVFYCALGGLKLYAVATNVLKNEELCLSGEWLHHLEKIGIKQAQSDGMVFDNWGNLYYGLIPLYGVGTWNVHDSFSKSYIVDENNSTLIWTDSFSFDDKGYLHLLTNNIHKYFDQSFDLSTFEGVKFRISKHFTGANSYLN